MTPGIPRPRGTAIGTMMRVSRDPLAELPKVQQEVGDTWIVDLPLIPTVVLSHPRDVHTVLVREFKSYQKDFYTRQLVPIIGNGLLLSEGDTWRRNRRLAQPAFHASAIRSYATAMSSLTEDTLDGWGERKALDVHAELMRLTLRIVARTLFGVDIGEDADVIGRALDTFMHVHLGFANTGLVVPPWVPTPWNQRFAAALADVDRIVYRMIREHRRGDPDAHTLLGLLLASNDESGGLTDTQLRDEAVTLLMAGHETTAIALTMALFLLSQHPNAEARLQAEVDTVLGDRTPTIEDLPNLPYTRQVVLEAMRLYPPAWSVGREALVDTVLGDVPIRKGMHLWIATWVTHRDARWYEDPLAFRPERWADGALEKALPDGAYVPFGAGPRVCIGKRFAELELTIVLTSIVRRYALRLEPGETLRLTPSVTLRPEGGLRMVATERRPLRNAA